jgi:MFS family permease
MDNHGHHIFQFCICVSFPACRSPQVEYLLIRKCMRFRNIHRNIPANHKRIILLRTNGHSRALNFYSRYGNCAAVLVTIIRGCLPPLLPVLLTGLNKFYGRRPIYLLSLSLGLLWLLTCALASNIQILIIARFLSVAGANAGDLFSPSQLQLPMTIYSGIQFMGPEMGPIAGGFINYYASWKWTFYFMMIWTGTGLVATMFFVPEAYRPVILRHRAERLKKEMGDERYVGADLAPTDPVLKTVLWSFFRPLRMLVLEPMCLNLCLHSAVLLGVLYLFFGAVPLVFTTNHGFNLWQVGLTFLGVAIGILGGVATTPHWQRHYLLSMKKGQRTGSVDGEVEPECRLPQVMAGAVLVPVGLFFFGFTTFSSVHWIAPIIASGVFGMG